MARKKKQKGSIIPFVICLVALIISVAALPFMDNLFIDKFEVTEDTIKEEIKTPTGYSCSYGPTYDEFYNYTKDEDIEFRFDEYGNVTHFVSSTSYQFLSQNNYQILKVEFLDKYDDENITFDDKNFIIITKIDTDKIDNTTYPNNYGDLKTYLSQNGYICSEN